ncbi:MAG: ATP-binding cassette domain-containing protein [Pseudomonadota bacterium]|nr:ATP-binding cassette domain-containing protein [Pseudomonadota bacterium]
MRPGQRRFLVPEVVQTSGMDCGPATLKALLDGHGLPVSYGRLREACQTSLDGTSIDVLEDIAGQLGLQAEQVMLPVDHLFEPESLALPALVVVVQPDGSSHFVVMWRRFGPWVQLMDPATGRRWTATRRFLAEVFVHSLPVPAAGWGEWARSAEGAPVLCRRLARLGVADARALCAAASADPGWLPLAALDAATRMVAALVAGGGLPRGAAAGALVRKLATAGAADPDGPIPPVYWAVRPLPPTPEGEEMVRLSGAVLVRVEGVRPADERAPLSAELEAAVQDRGEAPLRTIAAMVGAGGWLAPLLLLGALLAATLGGLIQTVLFRGLLDLVSQLGLVQQRLGGIAMLALFAAALLLVELPIAGIARAMGRGLEYRLRAAFLRKIPRLEDRYLQSRPSSDMAQRSHSVHAIRAVPDVAARMLRALLHLGATAAGLVWLDPANLPTVVIAAALCVAVPVAVQGPLTELDLRFRTHTGSLARFYLDAMLGLVAIRTHGAERSLRRAHESLLTEWARTGRASLGVVVSADVIQGLVAFALSAWLFVGWLQRSGDAAAALLVVYWALELPAIGAEIGQLARLYPGLRNITLRLLEPLGATEETKEGAAPGAHTRAEASGGAAVALHGVTVRAGGHTLLTDVDATFAPGEHVAIVGPSGAGKSSLVGLLLGWHRPAAGEVVVDGDPLAGDTLARLRQRTAWVDPSVQLWNRSFLDNLTYGNEARAADVGDVMRAADLVGVLQGLPDGLQHLLGEGGGLLSGGEGQRVRLGRALLRRDARLVILDEPFRGLDRERRHALLAEARQWWAGATLLCVTHDVGDTLGFARVLVVEEGRIVEEGAPEVLAARLDGRYRALLDAEADVRETLWGAPTWRRLRLDGGRIHG